IGEARYLEGPQCPRRERAGSAAVPARADRRSAECAERKHDPVAEFRVWADIWRDYLQLRKQQLIRHSAAEGSEARRDVAILDRSCADESKSDRRPADLLAA